MIYWLYFSKTDRLKQTIILTFIAEKNILKLHSKDICKNAGLKWLLHLELSFNTSCSLNYLIYVRVCFFFKKRYAKE